MVPELGAIKTIPEAESHSTDIYIYIAANLAVKFIYIHSTEDLMHEILLIVNPFSCLYIYSIPTLNYFLYITG